MEIIKADGMNDFESPGKGVPDHYLKFEDIGSYAVDRAPSNPSELARKLQIIINAFESPTYSPGAPSAAKEGPMRYRTGIIGHDDLTQASSPAFRYDYAIVMLERQRAYQEFLYKAWMKSLGR